MIKKMPERMRRTRRVNLISSLSIPRSISLVFFCALIQAFDRDESDFLGKWKISSHKMAVLALEVNEQPIDHLMEKFAGVDSEFSDEELTRVLEALKTRGMSEENGHEGHTLDTGHEDEGHTLDTGTSHLSANELIEEYGSGQAGADGKVKLSKEEFMSACPEMLLCATDSQCEFEIEDEDGLETSKNASEKFTNLKAGLAVAIFAESMFGWMIPMVSEAVAGRKARWVMSLMNAFSGGVFLAAGLTHLFPHLVEYQNEVTLGGAYPVGFSLALTGYLIVFFIERVLFHIHGHAIHSEGHDDHCCETPSSGNTAVISNEKGKHVNGDDDKSHGHSHHAHGGHHHDHSSEHHDHDSHHHDNHKQEQEHHGHSHAHDCGHHDDEKPTVPFVVRRNDTAQEVVAVAPPQEQNQPQTCAEMRIKKRPYILLTAISVHALLAGLTLGVQKSRTNILTIFTAIAAHKAPAALSIGSSFVNSHASKTVSITSMIVFSLTTTCGIFIGIALGSISLETVFILEALASGTFLYGGTSEIVADEFEMTDRDCNEHEGDHVKKVHAGRSLQQRLALFLAYASGCGVILLSNLAALDEHAVH